MARSRWKETEELIEASRLILSQEHPMTLRQLFYRLVSIQALENSRAAHQKLSRVISDAREGYEIDFSWIVDRSKVELIPNVWDSPESYLRGLARRYKKERWEDQDYHIEVWLEKDSLTGSIEDLCSDYGVALRAFRGFNSTTKKHELAEFFQGIDREIAIFYIGDHDPSGVDIQRDLKAALERYDSNGFTITRLAILPEDIKKFNLPPLRVKEKDSRTKKFKVAYGSDVIEADALPPSELRSRIENVLVGLIDWEAWERADQVEKAEIASIENVVKRFNELTVTGYEWDFSEYF